MAKVDLPHSPVREPRDFPTPPRVYNPWDDFVPQQNPLGDDDIELDYGGQEIPGGDDDDDDEEEEGGDDEETESEGDGDDDGDDDE